MLSPPSTPSLQLLSRTQFDAELDKDLNDVNNLDFGKVRQMLYDEMLFFHPALKAQVQVCVTVAP